MLLICGRRHLWGSSRFPRALLSSGRLTRTESDLGLAESARGKYSWEKRAPDALTDLVILRPHVARLVISTASVALSLPVFFLARAVIN